MKNLAAITAKRSAAKRKSKLSPKQVKKLLLLIRDEGYSYSAAGRAFGVSPRSARWRWLQYVRRDPAQRVEIEEVGR